MKMHENNKRNAMLTKQRKKKRGKGNKLQQGGCSSDQGSAEIKQNGM